MNDHEISSPSGYSFGIALLLVAAFFLFFAADIKISALKGNGDPGPRAIPIVLSLGVLLGGVIEIGTYVIRGRSRRDHSEQPGSLLSAENKKVAAFTVVLLVYVSAVPFAFYTSTFCFAALTIWFLGGRWWTAVVVSAAIDLLVWLLFVRLFLVPLPTLRDLLNF